jgi:hypothetical protein
MNARPSDPFTSHLAAAEIEADGTISRMNTVAIAAVRTFPGHCSTELEQNTGLLDGKIRKRLKALVRQGLIFEGEPRRSTVTGKLSITYWPTPQVRPALQPAEAAPTPSPVLGSALANIPSAIPLNIPTM